MSSEDKKLEDLSERIRRAEESKAPKEKLSPVRNAGYDFAGVILGSVIMGVLFDRFLGTAPWCLVGMVALGFITGVLGMMRATQKSQDKE